GMSVITGETGAGKSIMLDALGLTLGEGGGGGGGAPRPPPPGGPPPRPR
ncbi:hypothetical protein I5L57_28940, partial [Pseudomonas aeruginosa]|nr:hypothetical protein [Pseudomonas aeruginosa]